MTADCLTLALATLANFAVCVGAAPIMFGAWRWPLMKPAQAGLYRCRAGPLVG